MFQWCFWFQVVGQSRSGKDSGRRDCRHWVCKLSERIQSTRWVAVFVSVQGVRDEVSSTVNGATRSERNTDAEIWRTGPSIRYHIWMSAKEGTRRCDNSVAGHGQNYDQRTRYIVLWRYTATGTGMFYGIFLFAWICFWRAKGLRHTMLDKVVRDVVFEKNYLWIDYSLERKTKCVVCVASFT